MSSGIQLGSKRVLRAVKGWAVLVKQDPVESESSGGIVYSDTKKFQDEIAQTTGVVLSVGEHAWNDEPGPRCVVGDRIIFRQHAGQFLADVPGPDKYRIINDKDVYGVLEPME